MSLFLQQVTSIFYRIKSYVNIHINRHVSLSTVTLHFCPQQLSLNLAPCRGPAGLRRGLQSSAVPGEAGCWGTRAGRAAHPCKASVRPQLHSSCGAVQEAGRMALSGPGPGGRVFGLGRDNKEAEHLKQHVHRCTKGNGNLGNRGRIHASRKNHSCRGGVT